MAHFFKKENFRVLMKESTKNNVVLACILGGRGTENVWQEGRKKKKAKPAGKAIRKKEDEWDGRADSRSRIEKWLSCAVAAPHGQ